MLKKFGKKRKPLILFYGVWFVVLLSLVMYLVISSWQTTYDRAAESSANEVKILVNNLDSTLRRIESLMSWIEYNLQSKQDLSFLVTELPLLTKNFPEIRGFSLYTLQGEKIATDIFQECFSSEESLIALFSETSGELAFSDTFICEETQKPLIALFKYLTFSNPHDIGILVSFVDLSFYEGLFSRMEVGTNGIVSYRRSDTSQLVVRWPKVDDRLNNLAPLTPSHMAIQAGTHEGVIRYFGGTDGVERIFGFMKLERYPFYALVGREVGDVFGEWRIHSAFAIGLTLLLLGALGVFLVQLDKNLQLKNNLVHEILHRTNNSLQLVSSLIQLEIFETNPLSKEANRLSQLLSRVQVLGLVQGMLDKDYSSVPVMRLFTTLVEESISKNGRNRDQNQITIEPEHLMLLLDYAVPLSLILNELLMETQEGSVNISVIQKEYSLTVTYRTTGITTISDERMVLISTLGTHQLGGAIKLHSKNPFTWELVIPLNLYQNRIY
jgi:two-component sensor histidine kinase